MSDRLPPLTALRAFDAAARHMSFAKAADELNVTPAALSFQIKSLEDYLGAQVFRRLNRAIELTDEGRALVPGTRDGFAALTAAWRATQRLTGQSVLTVTAGPAFTSLWLAPRLYTFAAAHPEIELRFSASFNIVDFHRDDVDVAIRFGQGRDPGLYSLQLFDEWLTPMVTPQMAESIRRPEDLAKMTLLQDEQTSFIKPPVNWAAWFKVAGVAVDQSDIHGPRFNQADHPVSAALAGAGALMGRVSLTEAALRDGRLVMPFDLSLKSGATYRIVCPEGSEERPRVAAFIDWVTSEVDNTKDLSEGRRFVAAPDE
ncbi:MAG: transcriptional regulator GcvA [Silicimonas sp.]|nr:transcriptional regulator GcvA [Silicimonas sp.]